MAVKMYSSDSSFWRYKVCADIRGGSLWRGQTTVGLSTTSIFSVFAGYFFGNYRWGQRYHTAVRSPSSAFQWSQNAWPRLAILRWILFLRRFGWLRPCDFRKNNCVKTNKDRHILLAAQIFGRDSSIWQYKVCADILSCSVERRR